MLLLTLVGLKKGRVTVSRGRVLLSMLAGGNPSPFSE